MSNDSALPGQAEGALDWSAGLPESEWLKIAPGEDVALTIVARELRESNFVDERTASTSRRSWRP